MIVTRDREREKKKGKEKKIEKRQKEEKKEINFPPFSDYSRLVIALWTCGVPANSTSLASRPTTEKNTGLG